MPLELLGATTPPAGASVRRDCACVGESVGEGKLLVVAYVIPQDGTDPSPDELLEFGRKHLASYKAPKVVYLAREFPRTRNGKVLRREITATIATARSEGKG